jgi:hypothetical protein
LTTPGNSATSHILQVEQKGILAVGGIPVRVYVDEQQVGTVGANGKLFIPVSKGEHTLRLKLFPYAKNYKFLIQAEDTQRVAFKRKFFGFKMITVNE